MRAVRASFLLLQLSAHLSRCSSSSFGRRGASLLAFEKPVFRRRRRRGGSGAGRDALRRLRGGSDGGSTPSYHGNYVSSPTGELPKGAVGVTGGGAAEVTPDADPTAAAATAAPAAAATAASTTAAAAAATVSGVPATLASQTSAEKKISNLQERTGPAVLMLAAAYLLIRLTGSKGMMALVFLMQVGMYYESTSVVGDFNSKKEGEDGDVISSVFQKWWWFATAIMLTSGRKMISDATSLSMDQMNLITFGMSSMSLVGVVIQLAMVSSDVAEDIYRSYLGKVACCHFSLLFLVGQSSFWIRTIKDYGLVWVLFPALLVVVNDTMAYVFGVLLGKHKLLPRLSPKKTVEGFVGAGLSTLAVAAPLLRRMAEKDSVADLGKHALMLALYVSLVSPFGGFLASAVKRAHGAKDFGTLIPGHGGAVDRFDCQVVTAPFVYLYLKNFLAESGAVVEPLIEEVAKVVSLEEAADVVSDVVGAGI